MIFVAIPDFSYANELQKETGTATLDVLRISGNTRYTTSTSIADYYREKTNGNAKLKAVVIATGENFPDALTGGFFANQKNAPIIMINKGSASDVISYIKNNIVTGGTVYVLGGTGVVPDAWLDEVKYTRLSGTDRYSTNVEILNGAGVSEGDMLICTGKNYADALSASGLGMPILLVGDTLTNEQKSFLSKGKWQLHIVGGTGAVNESFESQLKQYDQDRSIDRIAGSTRYDTSEKLANRFVRDAGGIVLATGKAFPDGLCGGPLASSLNAPIVLADPGKDRTNARNYVSSRDIENGIVLGGTGRIDDETVRYIFHMSAGDEVAVYSKGEDIEENIISVSIGSDNKLMIHARVNAGKEDIFKIGLSPAYEDTPTHFMNVAKAECVEDADKEWSIAADESLSMENLYEKVYLLHNDEAVGPGFYIQNPEMFAEITTEYPRAVSKKGLKISANQGDVGVAKTLEVGHVLLDVNLAQYIQKGGYNYKGYSFNNTAIQTRKELIKAYNEAGIQVTVVVVLSKNGKDLIYPAALSGADIDAAHFVAFNTKEGREKVQALLEVLAYEWCSDGAFVSNWICGNELNNKAWNYAGNTSWDEYISVTADMYRLFNTAVKGTVRNAKTFLCFDRKWNGSEGDEEASTIGARGVLESISNYLEKEGYIHFDVALHPYADNLFYPEWWNDSASSDPLTTASTSMKNIRKIAGYLNKKYDSRVILSEQGFVGEYPDGTDCQEVQAAAIMAAYYMAAFDDNIDLFGYHRLRDHPNELKNKGPLPIGLYKVKESALEEYYAAADGTEKASIASQIFADPLNYEERLAAEVFRYMDSADYIKADSLAPYYDSSLRGWDSFPGFDRTKLR